MNIGDIVSISGIYAGSLPDGRSRVQVPATPNYVSGIELAVWTHVIEKTSAKHAQVVYVVHDVYLLGKDLHEVYANEIDALRSTAGELPPNVLRRSITRKVVK